MTSVSWDRHFTRSAVSTRRQGDVRTESKVCQPSRFCQLQKHVVIQDRNTCRLWKVLPARSVLVFALAVAYARVTGLPSPSTQQAHQRAERVQTKHYIWTEIIFALDPSELVSFFLKCSRSVNLSGISRSFRRRGPTQTKHSHGNRSNLSQR